MSSATPLPIHHGTDSRILKQRFDLRSKGKLPPIPVEEQRLNSHLIPGQIQLGAVGDGKGEYAAKPCNKPFPPLDIAM